MTADQAIVYVRTKRPNSIQTRGQLLCVREFSKFLIPLRNVFASCEPKAHAVTLSQYLIRQRHLLHGYESRHLKYVPKLIHLVCKLLLDLVENRHMIEEEVVDVPDLSAEIEDMVSLDNTELDDETGQDSSTSESLSHSGSAALHLGSHERDLLWKRRNIGYLQPLSHAKRRMSYSESDLRRAVYVSEHGETPWSVPMQVSLCNKINQKNEEDDQALRSEINKEMLVRSTFTFWSQGKFNLDGKGGRSPLCYRNKHSKEVQRSHTFSSGIRCDREEEDEEDDEELRALNYNCRRTSNIYGRRTWSSEDSDSSKAECDSHDFRELSESIPHIVVQSELTLDARRILAVKALADLNEFMGAKEVNSKVEKWQVFSHCNFAIVMADSWERPSAGRNSIASLLSVRARHLLC